MMTNMQFHKKYEISLILVRPEKPNKLHKGKIGRIVALDR